MNDILDILIYMIEKSLAQAKQLGSLRAILMTFLGIMAVIIHGVLISTGLNKYSFVFTVLLITFGSYGLVASAFLYKQSQDYINTANKLYQRLDDLSTNVTEQVIKEFAKKYQIKSSTLVRSIRFNLIWIGLPVLTVLLGVTFTVIILVH